MAAKGIDYLRLNNNCDTTLREPQPSVFLLQDILLAPCFCVLNIGSFENQDPDLLNYIIKIYM